MQCALALILLFSSFGEPITAQRNPSFLVVLFQQQAPIDATALTFTLGKGYFIVRVGRSSFRATTAAEMNRFLDAHLKEIDPKKIIIFGDPKAKYKEFAPILDVLKKHDWLHFKLQDINAKPSSPIPPSKVETVFTGYLDPVC